MESHGSPCASHLEAQLPRSEGSTLWNQPWGHIAGKPIRYTSELTVTVNDGHHRGDQVVLFYSHPPRGELSFHKGDILVLFRVLNLDVFGRVLPLFRLSDDD